jgi:hypothetical protein
MEDVKSHSPLASFTCFGGIGTVGSLAISVNYLLTKLCELLESIKMSITLFFTNVLSLMEFGEVTVDRAFKES